MEHSTPCRTPASAPESYRNTQPATPAAAHHSPTKASAQRDTAPPVPSSVQPAPGSASARPLRSGQDPATIAANIRAVAYKSARARAALPDIDFITGLPIAPSLNILRDIPIAVPPMPQPEETPPEQAPLFPTRLAPSVPEDQAGLGDPATYDPADYRWVPVRRKPRSDGWTEEKMRRFIEVLADTGIVSLAAKAVGMSRESARQLRRSPHGAAFSRAWDIAREHASGMLEDIAFERVIEGEEHNVYNEYGEVVCTKRVYSNSLLTFLLSSLKPERYSKEARTAAVARANQSAARGASNDNPVDPTPPPQRETLDDCLRAMEPQLPAPPEELLDPETLEQELDLAEIADGELPLFLTEQHPAKSAARLAEERAAEAMEQGRLASAKMDRGEEMTDAEFRDLCHYLDPAQRDERPKRLYR